MELATAWAAGQGVFSHRPGSLRTLPSWALSPTLRRCAEWTGPEGLFLPPPLELVSHVTLGTPGQRHPEFLSRGVVNAAPFLARRGSADVAEWEPRQLAQGEAALAPLWPGQLVQGPADSAAL